MLNNTQHIAELPLWQNKIIDIWKKKGDAHFYQLTILTNVLF